MSDPLRQTGRTTRMLEAALRDAQNPNLPEGSIAIVVGHNFYDLDRLIGMLKSLADKANVTIDLKRFNTAIIGNATIVFTTPHREAGIGIRPYAIYIDHFCWDSERVAPMTEKFYERMVDAVRPTTEALSR